MSFHDKKARGAAVARILEMTASVMGCQVADILSRDVGSAAVSRARMAFCYTVRPIMFNHETGTILGRRNSGTIDSSWRRCLKVMEQDEVYRDKVNRLIDACVDDREKYQISKKIRVH